MERVDLAVEDVVEAVDGAGCGAEREDGGERVQRRTEMEELLGEEEPEEDEDVLHPVAHAHELDVGRDARALRAHPAFRNSSQFRAAMAMIVPCGLTPGASGSSEASATRRFSNPQTRP